MPRTSAAALPCPALPWWGAKDNKALLYAYWKCGLNLYNYLDRSHMVCAEQLMIASNSTADFTVKVGWYSVKVICKGA